MAPDPCQSVQDQLSAFFDGELGTAERRQVEAHLTECPLCQSELARFQRVSERIRDTAETAVPQSWASIEGALGVRRPDPAVWWWRRNVGIAAAVAATLLLAVGIWANMRNSNLPQVAQHGGSSGHGDMMPGMEMDPEHMREFQEVMDDYLVRLSVDPGQAEDFLLTKYEGQRVAPEQAETLVGYKPLIARGLPDGYKLTSSSVVKMPCCTCFKATCRRSDGSTLVLFEHDDEQAVWFGDRKSTMATCGDKDCCLVELDSNIAATWKEGSRSITAVGARDENEVAMLVNALKRS